MDKFLEQRTTRALNGLEIIRGGLVRYGISLRADFRDAWHSIYFSFYPRSMPTKAKSKPYRIQMNHEHFPLHPRPFRIYLNYEGKMVHSETRNGMMRFVESSNPLDLESDDGYWLVVKDFCKRQVQDSWLRRGYSINVKQSYVDFRSEEDAVAFKLIMGE